MKATLIDDYGGFGIMEITFADSSASLSGLPNQDGNSSSIPAAPKKTQDGTSRDRSPNGLERNSPSRPCNPCDFLNCDNPSRLCDFSNIDSPSGQDQSITTIPSS